jgi:hypothetical protein
VRGAFLQSLIDRQFVTNETALIVKLAAQGAVTPSVGTVMCVYTSLIRNASLPR